MKKTFDESKDEVAQLCQYFATNHQEFLASDVKEAHVRQSLIDPLFEALGWDVRNADKVAPRYREVIPEASVDVEGHTRAPDYCFRVGTLPKFYVEAKKCGVNINMDPAAAQQLRLYGWNGKVAFSILTDFEELGVYDCTIPPRPTDKASHARIQYFRFNQYPDRWREIWDVFSREAVWSGAFDKYAATKRKRGTSEVDVEFLKEIEGWRDSLARNIALRNEALSSDDLNAAVQLTIDRVVFLRMAEDRGIEPDEQLLKLSERPEVYARFMHDLCYQADQKYNSGLFHFKEEKGVSEAPDHITPNLSVDDKVFKPILQNLYFAHGSPYHFGALPVEILGTIYERFLGKVIRLTTGHRAKIEEKPEVRKAGGVYYTPAYIVDYIVTNTVGVHIENKSPSQLAGVKNREPFRILDMACGSGSFLLGAYKYLLDHCLEWYLDHNPIRHRKTVYKDVRGGQWRLTIPEKKRILTTHLFGVDIDPQAVEVSKLSLLLKVLEGETDQTIGQQMQLFHERALPNLADNIKCGNSLIGPAYFTGGLLPDADEMKRVNPYDWDKEFPEAKNNGGFDCIIGNPPYGAEFLELTSTYLKNRYSTYVLRGESYLVFIERAITLLKTGGQFGYIVPDTYLNLGFTQTLRDYLLHNTKLREIVSLPSKVFSGATVDTTLLFAEKADYSQECHEFDVAVQVFNKKRSISSVTEPDRVFKASTGIWQKLNAFNVNCDPMETALIRKLETIRDKISDTAEMFSGIKVYEVGKGAPPQTPHIRDTKPYTSSRKESKAFDPFFDGKHIGRYTLLWNQDNWVKYGPWLAAPRNPEHFVDEKILVRKIVGETLIATYIPKTSYCNTLLHVLKIRPDSGARYQFLLGILNSRFIGWYFRKKFQISADDTFPQIMIRDIMLFPLPHADEAGNEKMVSLIESMVTLQKQLYAAKSEAQKVVMQRQIDATDAEIDRLVYSLYDLTEEEIAIVERASALSPAP